VCVQLLSVDPDWPAERDFRLVSRLHVTSGGVRQSGGISNGPQHDGSNPSRHDPLQELNQIDPHPPKTIRVSLKWKTQKKKILYQRIIGSNQIHTKVVCHTKVQMRKMEKNQLKEVRGNRSDLKEVGKSVTTLFWGGFNFEQGK
jgi:hypothetical protein